jgi:hypothetical protein
MKLRTSMLRGRGVDVCLTLVGIAVLALAESTTALAASSKRGKPIMLEKSGGFEIGGTVIMNGTNPNQTLSCDHGYVE